MLTCNDINDGDLNPKVQIELEKLNTSSLQINEFENKLQELRNIFYETLSKCSSNLSEISNKVGAAIPRARPYFELKRAQLEIQRESQMAACRYETACIELKHANAVVSKSESMAKETATLDDSAMEILNIAIAKVNLAKKAKTEAHREHQKYLASYRELEANIRVQERRHKNDIRKSMEYFQYSQCMEEKLKEDKLNIESFEEKVKICKSIYNQSLQRLEEISNQIHEERKKKELLGPRGEGVGAEVNKLYDEAAICSRFEIDNEQRSPSTTTEGHITPDNHSTISRTLSLCSTSRATQRRTTLVSSTPLVDGLLRATQHNQMSFHYGTNRHLYRTIPRDFHFNAAQRASTDLGHKSTIDESGDHL